MITRTAKVLVHGGLKAAFGTIANVRNSIAGVNNLGPL
jgi:hypothetical protein